MAPVASNVIKLHHPPLREPLSLTSFSSKKADLLFGNLNLRVADTMVAMREFFGNFFPCYFMQNDPGAPRAATLARREIGIGPALPQRRPRGMARDRAGQYVWGEPPMALQPRGL